MDAQENKLVTLTIDGKRVTVPEGTKLTDAAEASASGAFKFAYYTAVSDRITFAIYDVHGRVVARLVDMDMAPGIYNATWDGMTQSRQKAPPGIYFARVSNSWTWDTRKITLNP